MSHPQEPIKGGGHFPSGSAPTDASPPRKPLGLFDAVSIIVGIVVGAGIYQTVPFILKNVSDPVTALSAWAVAGVLSIIGALCYAELATTYPRTGGDYVYLGRAFGPWLGFLFGWVQLTVILTGSIGMMAFIFADYFSGFMKAMNGIAIRDQVTWQLGGSEVSGNLVAWVPAIAAVVGITLLNILGVVFGKVTQNVLSLAKVAGLTAIVVAGFMAPTPDAWQQTSLSVDDLKKLTFPFFAPSLGVAMVLILYTYGGWNDAAFVAAEVRNGKRNITLALILGLLLVTALYMLVNVAYINSLGFQGAQSSSQIAADVLHKGFGSGGASLMCALVMVSALGAVNGLVFTGARVYSTVGKDHPLLSWMGGWSQKQGSPVPALITQGVITLGLIFLVGSEQGRGYINELFPQEKAPPVVSPDEQALRAVFEQHGVPPELFEKEAPKEEEPPPSLWHRTATWAGLKRLNFEGAGGFDTLLACTAPVFWLFFLLTGLSLFVLRGRDKHIERPFKVPLYPELPLIFCATCVYLLYSSVDYALGRGWKGGLLLFAVIPFLAGVLLWRISLMVAPGRDSTDEGLDERPV